jgi:hypothetical protein
MQKNYQNHNRLFFCLEAKRLNKQVDIGQHADITTQSKFVTHDISFNQKMNSDVKL